MGITIRAARVNANLTQQAAAKALGISQNTLLGYEKGRKGPRIDMVQKMAKLYEVSMNDLIFLSNDST